MFGIYRKLLWPVGLAALGSFVSALFLLNSRALATSTNDCESCVSVNVNRRYSTSSENLYLSTGSAEIAEADPAEKIVEKNVVKTEGLQRPEIKSDSHLQEVINDQKTYEEWQGSKIQSNAEWVYAVDEKVYLKTKKRYASLDVRGLNLLCIGARAGGEVRAFIGLGAYALGIDVAPSPKSKYVLYGDGRNLQFASTSVDIIFTNILDHIPDLTLFAKEVARVLKPNGILIAEVLDQLRTDDEWAVRDTGTDAFYAEFEASIRNTSMIACHVDHGVHKYNQLIVLQSLQASDQKCTGINVAALSTINVNRV